MDHVTVFGRTIKRSNPSSTWAIWESLDYSPCITVALLSENNWAIWVSLKPIDMFTCRGGGRSIEEAELRVKADLKELIKKYQVLAAELGV